MKNFFNLFCINTPIVTGIIFGVIGTLSNIMVPLVVRSFIDINEVSFKDIKYLVCIVIFLVIQTILISISTFLITREGDKQIANIRCRVKKHILRLPTQYFDDNNSGEIASRIINDVSILRAFVTTSVPQLINGLVMITVSLVIITYLDWKFTILLFIIFPLVIIVAIPIGIINERTGIRTQKSLSKLNGMASENIRNIRSIKLNNAESSVFTSFKKEINYLYEVSLTADKVSSLTGPIQGILSIILIISVFIYGNIRVNTGTLTEGTLVAFMFLLFQLTVPINSVINFFSSYKLTQGSISKIYSIMNTPLENSYEFSKTFLDIKKIHNPYSLLLKNATFAYNDSIILDDVTMCFKAGEKVAIVGATGAGKSTIINIITRLYPLTKGTLYLNDNDSSEFKLNDWRRLFGVVSQENSIFSGSLLDNIIFGLDNIPSEREINKALEVAHLEKDIRAMPNGLDTFVGEQGIKISGGQRQRIQIARAYLKDAEFLILDEATSNLDSDAEKKVSDQLDKIMKEKTIISIAHRLSTVVDADKIYFIEDKKVRDVGNHFELLSRVPAYKKFIEEQMIKTENKKESITTIK